MMTKYLSNDIVEKYFLASLLCETSDIRKNYEKIREIVNENYFLNSVNKKIFIAIKKLYEEEKPIDFLTIYQKTQEISFPVTTIDPSYLAELVSLFPTSGFLTYYADELIKTRSLIEIKELAEEIKFVVESQTLDFEKKVKEISKRTKKILDLISNFDNPKNENLKINLFKEILFDLESFISKSLENPETHLERLINAIYEYIVRKEKIKKEKKDKIKIPW